MFKAQLKKYLRGWRNAKFLSTFHDEQNSRASATYDAIVSQDPSRKLSATQRKLIGEYSKDIFGSLQYAPWLEAYSAYRGDFVEGWIPNNYYVGTLVPSWMRYSNIASKILAKRILGTDQIPDIAYHFNGFWLDRDNQNIPLADLKDRVFRDTDTVVAKLEPSSQGRGVWKVRRSDFDPHEFSQMGDLVLQRPIQQHPFFERFTSDSVATLRVTTVKEPGKEAVKKASYLRVARHGAPIVRSSTSIRIPVVDDHGTLSERGANSNWTSLAVHPDSGTAFSGLRVPGFDRAVAWCQALHDQSPVSVLIGWDVAIDPSGAPVLMEWNQGRAGVKFTEASIGPSFKGLGWENVWKRGA